MTNQSEITENILKEYANEKKNIECIDPIDHYDAFYFCAKKMIEQDEKNFKNNMFYTNLIDVMAEKIRKTCGCEFCENNSNCSHNHVYNKEYCPNWVTLHYNIIDFYKNQVKEHEKRR